MKKRAFTLLEVVIAFSLMGVLLFFLFQTQRHLAVASKKIEDKKRELTKEERFYFRLSQIFSSISSCKTIEEEKKLLLYHDGGSDRDVRFRGRLTSLLYLEHDCVRLATWPEEGECRIETFWEKAEALSFNIEDKKMLIIKVDSMEFPFFL